MRDSKSAISLTHHLKYIFLLLVVVICGCKGCFEQTKTPPDWTTYLSDQKGAVLSPTPEKQLIVFIKPGTGRAAFNTFLDTGIVKHKDGALKIISVCGSCDSTLLMLEGSGVEAFINGEVVKGGSTSRGGAKLSGENELLYFTTNKSIGFDVLPGSGSNPRQFPGYTYQDSITLAVFDTGLTPELFNGYLVNSLPETPCIPDATDGWNFFTWNNNWKDDNLGLHGTIVSRFIINEVEKYRKTKVKVLPVKVFNAEGEADLYTILCGFAYASHSGANIVNASFGFYESKTKFRKGEPTNDTTSAALLKNFISRYLTEKNILLVCAAGNKNDEDSTIRSLDEINFYPASLSVALPNIIPVTTVGMSGKGRIVSPNQNFSPAIVQLGVDCDLVDGDHFGFSNPMAPLSKETVAGSSFAAPVAAGELSAYYTSFKNLLNGGQMNFVTRDSIFSILATVQPTDPILINDSLLLQKINKGKVINRQSEIKINSKSGRQLKRGFEDKGLRLLKK